MLFFLNLDGTVTRNDTEHIYQGQNNAATIDVITAVSPAQTAIQVAFTLPNGLAKGYFPMMQNGRYNLDDDQVQIWKWSLAVPYNITELEGIVGVSFNIVKYNGLGVEDEVESDNQTTYTASFRVEYSLLPEPPSDVDEKDIERILDLLTLYYNQNAKEIQELKDSSPNFRYVPKRLSEFPETTGFRQRGSIYVDDGENSFRMSLTSVKELNTKIVCVNDANDADMSQLTVGDFIYTKN